MTKEELENKYPAGSMVELLGSKFKGKIVGNFRLMKPTYPGLNFVSWPHNYKSNDPELKEWIKEARNNNVGDAEWFVDVEVLGEIKPLNIMMLC